MPHLVTETPSSLATEASGSRKEGITSLATEILSFMVTEVSDFPATKALPAVESKAPSSLAMEGPPSMATETPPSLTTEVPLYLQTHSLSLDEESTASPKSTHDPILKSGDREASETRMPSRSPEISPHLKVSLTGIQEPLPHSQEEGEAEAKLPSSSKVLASVFPAQDEPGELQPTLDHMGHTFSESLPNLPSTPATAKAMGGRTLALQLSLQGKACIVCPTFPSDSRLSAFCPHYRWYRHEGHVPLNRRSFLPGC